MIYFWIRWAFCILLSQNWRCDLPRSNWSINHVLWDPWWMQSCGHVALHSILNVGIGNRRQIYSIFQHISNRMPLRLHYSHEKILTLNSLYSVKSVRNTWLLTAALCYQLIQWRIFWSKYINLMTIMPHPNQLPSNQILSEHIVREVTFFKNLHSQNPPADYTQVQIIHDGLQKDTWNTGQIISDGID